MASIVSRIPASWQAGVVRALYALPAPVRRAVAGPPVHVDGQRLDLDTQLLLKLSSLEGVALSAATPEDAGLLLADADSAQPTLEVSRRRPDA